MPTFAPIAAPGRLRRAGAALAAALALAAAAPAAAPARTPQPAPAAAGPARAPQPAPPAAAPARAPQPSPAAAPARPPQPAPAAAGPAGAPAAVHRPTARAAWTARIARPVLARARPDRRARDVRALTPRARWRGGPEVLLVLRTRVVGGERWLDLLVKGRPAGAHGWIPATAATLRRTERRIVVDLSRRTLAFQRAGRTRLRTPIVIGAPATPTPTGQFAVDAAAPVPARARLGPRVLALVAYSPTLTTYDGGLPQVAIHAYERLGAPLGRAASHGCLRAPQPIVDRLLALAPRGTPVLIAR